MPIPDLRNKPSLFWKLQRFENLDISVDPKQLSACHIAKLQRNVLVIWKLFGSETNVRLEYIFYFIGKLLWKFTSQRPPCKSSYRLLIQIQWLLMINFELIKLQDVNIFTVQPRCTSTNCKERVLSIIRKTSQGSWLLLWYLIHVTPPHNIL